MSKYFVMYNPANFDLMSLDRDKCASPLDLVTYLTNRDASKLDLENYLDYLHFDLRKRREAMVETFGIENGAALYIGNQIARLAPEATVVHADDNRTAIGEAIKSQGAKPEAVFISSISSNFPGAVSAAIVLNRARIPVVLGGIHVSTTPEDVESFIRNFCPHPELVIQVRGPGDSHVIGELLRDLEQGTLKREYVGHTTIEDGVWRIPPNVLRLPHMCMDTHGRVPFLGRFLQHKVRVNSVAPCVGCPYSCSFCSISTLPLNQRGLVLRSPADVLDELTAYQESEEASVPWPIVLFATDNLLLGGHVLDEVLEGIIERKLKTPFMAQISIEVASNERLLQRLRLAGAVTFEFGFESLDIRNLEHINKHCVRDIRKSGLPVSEYYSRQIKKIHNHGIGVQGSFIFGLPFDWFDSFEANTGTEVAEFCTDNHISLMPHVLVALPGSRVFQESIEAGTFLYGHPGTMDYLRALCIADHGEMNIEPSETLRKSPLLVGVMVLEALRRVGTRGRALRNAAYMARKAFACPTARGGVSNKERVEDSLLASVTELITLSLYRDIAERLASSRNGRREGLQRLYETERDPEVKRLCQNYVAEFLL